MTRCSPRTVMGPTLSPGPGPPACAGPAPVPVPSLSGTSTESRGQAGATPRGDPARHRGHSRPRRAATPAEAAVRKRLGGGERRRVPVAQLGPAVIHRGPPADRGDRLAVEVTGQHVGAEVPPG